jgi:superfamily II DNA or RNA helicase
MRAGVIQAPTMGRLSFGGVGPSPLMKHAQQGFKMPGLKSGINLFDHQKEAVQKVLDKDGNLLLSHPVGSGKTLSSIAAFEALRGQGKAERALVVVPAALRVNYIENGVKKFTNEKGAIFGTSEEISKGTGVSAENPDPHARYHVVSYDLFRKDPKKYIDAAKADTVIYDELHKAKNEGVLTSQAIKEARPFHKNFIGMTGSIVSNTPADIVPLVDAMTNGKHVLGNKTSFEARFVKTDEQGNKKLNHPQVIRTLLGPYVHHVDPSTLNTSAPKKLVEEVQVEMSPHQADLYKFVTKDLDWVTQKKLEMGIGKLNTAELNDLFAKLLRLRQVSNAVHTVDTRMSVHDSAEQTPKVKKILDDVEQHLQETPDGQVVIHTNMIQGGVDVLTAGLKKRGIDHALFIGKGQPGVTEKSRQHGVAEFQAGKKKVIVLSAAGGEGLDLPNTTFMAMMDGHFNPEKINQAEARGVRAGGQSHRKAEDRQVVVRRYVSVLPNDLSRKANVLKGIWDNNPVSIGTRLMAGGDPFVNPFKKPKSTDEWVYDVAKNKAKLNTELYGAVKTGSIQMSCPRTHEEFEEILGFDKVASSGPEKAMAIARGIVEAVENTKHPELLGAAVGALYGGLMAGGTGPRTKRQAEQDPRAPLRNRLGAFIGGAAGGALAGHAVRSGGLGSAPNAAGMVSTSAMAGRSIANVWAPGSKVPTSVVDVLGKGKTRYSDKDLFEKYWDEFGDELQNKGIDAHVENKEREQKYVSALKDLYAEARQNNTKTVPISKGKFIRNAAIGAALMPVVGWAQTAYSHAFMDGQLPKAKETALATLPLLAAYGGGIARTYRDSYVDPGVSVHNKSEAKTRSKFEDEQLRNLLRGLGVEEVKTKQHVIK